MSFNEKSTATMLAVLVLVYGWYFSVVLVRLADSPAREIAYRGMLLASVVVLVGLAVVSHVILAAVSFRDLDQAVDERDRLITMRAERLGGWIVSVGAIAGLVLVLVVVEVEADSFWIANAILGGLVVGQVAEYGSMLVEYRRGL